MDHPASSDLLKEGPKGPASDLAFLSGGGEMGERMRAFDFSTTPLGAVSAWPQSLRSAVSICLNSRFPIVLYWGKQFVSLYNDAYIPVWGEKHPWALGKPFEIAWADIWNVLGPVLNQVMETGIPSWSDDQLLIMQRHGYAEETYFTFSFGAGRDEQGEVAGIFCAVTETTQRVLHERRLAVLRELTGEAKSLQEAATLATQILDGQADIPFALLYLSDKDGRTARLAAHTGIPSNSSAAPPVLDIAADDSGAWPFAQAVTTGAPTTVTDLDRRFGPLSGGPWPESTHMAVVLPLQKAGQSETAGLLILGVSPRRHLDESYQWFFELVAGHVATMLANAHAYEEERKRAEALAELDCAKTAFFSNVSHEFRTPLTLMLGPLEELKAQLGRSTSSLDSRRYQQVDVVHRNGLRLLKLVNTLLEFSRIEAGRAQALYEETDLAAFTTELASVFRSTIEKAGLSLIVDCPPLPEPGFVDRDMWEKIVLNLLSNAFKFTFEGEIAVSLRTEDSGPTRGVTLRVSDTGVGIPADELPRMFERFHRIAHSQGRAHEGTGIGLALMQELVKLHGGAVRAESIFGEGSTFAVTIPFGTAHLPADRIGAPGRRASTATGVMPFVEEALRWLPSDDRTEDSGLRTELSESEGSALSPQPSVLGAEATHPRVLLADDNADMRDYVRRLLSSQGYEVESVADGQAALDCAKANPPDLVLTDVMMPRLDGFALMKALRADERTRAIPIIILSARAGEEACVEGVSQGADDYLTKPFSARELLARVTTQLELSRIRLAAANDARRYAEELRESEEWLRHANAELARRVTEVQRANEEVRDSRRAALNLMEDAVRARQAMETLNEELRASEEALRRLNDQLEQRVAERTYELAQSEDHLRALATELNLAEQRERMRLATELHDHLQQMLVLGRLTVGQGKRVAAGVPAYEQVLKKVDDIFSDALTYSRTLVSDLSPTVLRDHGLAAALQWLGTYMQKHNQTVIVTVPDDGDLKLPEDRVILLFQSVRELLINSSKYAGTGEATVRMEQRDGLLRIEVRDEGAGFDLAAAAAAAGIPSGGISSKFGLFSIRERMRALGGLFQIESAPGKGTRATLILPLGGGAAARTENSGLRTELSGSNSALQQHAKIRVLLVDDHPMVRQGLRSIVTAYDHLEIVGEASNGAEAVELAQRLNPDVVVMDINMPKMDGIEATQQIKANQPTTVVIGLSVNQSTDTEQKMKAAGVFTYLTKESAVDVLCHAIEQAMSHKQPTAARPVYYP